MNLKSIMLTERKKATHCMILLIGLYGIGKAVISKGGMTGSNERIKTESKGASHFGVTEIFLF